MTDGLTREQFSVKGGGGGAGEGCLTASISGFRARATKFTRSGSPRTLIAEAINLWLTGSIHYCIEKERK